MPSGACNFCGFDGLLHLFVVFKKKRMIVTGGRMLKRVTDLQRCSKKKSIICLPPIAEL